MAWNLSSIKLAFHLILVLYIVSQVDGYVTAQSKQQAGDKPHYVGYSDSKKNVSTQCSGDSSCPPWFYCSDESSECTCGEDHDHIIICNQTHQTSAVLDCYCVTFDERRNTTVTGACFYNCENHQNKRGVDLVYHALPSKLSKLNKVMCEHHSLKRTGPLCGECMPNTYPLVYSYNLSCVHCPDGHKNWWQFMLAAFLPLTVFYFVVLFLKISATSSHLHGYVLFSQSISIPAFVRIILPTIMNNPRVLVAFQVTITMYGIWNLDFFRAILPNICLQTTTLQTLALDYVIAIYPLFLMIVSYVLIELHERNFRVVVLIWKPFRFVFTFFRRNWDSRTSVIDAYATFFLLSSSKFFSTSFDLLTPTYLYTLNSNESGTLVLYYDGSIEYFGKEHLPYAILAIAVVFICYVLPITLLFLYPWQWFQKFLNCFPVRWYNILHTFVDSFLGCYKDGTEPGTRDCRWFAILFLVWRMLILLVYSVTTGSTYFPGAILLLLLFTLLIVIVQPFKSTVAHYTKINATFVLLIALFYAGIVGKNVSSTKGIRLHKPYLWFTVVFGTFPLVYISCIGIHWLFAQRKWGKNIILKLKAWTKGYEWSTFENEQDFEDSLPDRIVNPGQYHENNLTDFQSVSYQSRDATSYNTY